MCSNNGDEVLHLLTGKAVMKHFDLLRCEMAKL